MKIAYLMSGHLRTFPHVVDSQRKFLYNQCHSESPGHIYISVWDDWGYFPVNEKIHHTRWDPPHIKATHRNKISSLDVELMVEKLNPISYEIESPFESLEFIQSVLDGIPNQGPGHPTHVPWNYVCMNYKNYRTWNLIEHPDQYDLIVKLRPDLEFYDYVDFSRLDVDDKLHTPLINSWGGANDQLAFGTPEVMFHYYDMFPYLANHSSILGHIHPETTLAYHLRDRGVEVSSDWDVNYDIIRHEELDSRPTLENAKQIYNRRIGEV